MSEKSTSSIMSAFGHVADALQSGHVKSVAQYTKDQRIAPAVAVDATLMSNPILVDSLHTLNGIFSAYIMQSALRKLNVNNIHTQRVLHSLSTNRTKLGSATIGVGTLGEIAASMEDFNGGLPNLSVDNDQGFSMEAYGDDTRVRRRESRSAKGNVEQLQKPANLGVGRILEIDVGVGDNTAPMQLMVQFQTQVAPPSVLENLLVTGVQKQTAKQRFTKWRAGELRGWEDIVLLDDVIKAERDLRAADAGSGMFKRILENRRKGGFLSLLSLNPHINELSNIIVLSQSSFDRVQAEVGKIEFNQRKRDEMFERSGAIFLAVLNEKYDTMTLYTHSMEESTELTSRMIKTMGGKNDIDVMDIFKQFQGNNSLVF